MDVGCAWLLRQGYEVYRNVSQHGLIDMIAIKDSKPSAKSGGQAGKSARWVQSNSSQNSGPPTS
jgi:hypothetical protein